MHCQLSQAPINTRHPMMTTKPPFTDRPLRRSARRTRPGFTVVELLITITIVIVLAALSVGFTRKIRTNAAKVKDMNNLRNLALAAMASGADSAGRLPSLHSTSYAPYWLSARNILESYGISKTMCYAPTTGITGGAPDYKWWYMDPSGTPTHYVYFANDGSTKDNGWCSKGNLRPPSQQEYRGAIAYQDIIKDSSKAFARNIDDNVWYPILWAGLCRDYTGSPRTAALLDNDGEAIGINVMYLDGHCEWVPGNKLQPRFTAGGLKLFW